MNVVAAFVVAGLTAMAVGFGVAIVINLIGVEATLVIMFLALLVGMVAALIEYVTTDRS